MQTRSRTNGADHLANFHPLQAVDKELRVFVNGAQSHSTSKGLVRCLRKLLGQSEKLCFGKQLVFDNFDVLLSFFLLLWGEPLR